MCVCVGGGGGGFGINALSSNRADQAQERAQLSRKYTSLEEDDAPNLTVPGNLQALGQTQPLSYPQDAKQRWECTRVQTWAEIKYRVLTLPIWTWGWRAEGNCPSVDLPTQSLGNSQGSEQ